MHTSPGGAPWMNAETAETLFEAIVRPKGLTAQLEGCVAHMLEAGRKGSCVLWIRSVSFGQDHNIYDSQTYEMPPHQNKEELNTRQRNTPSGILHNVCSDNFIVHTLKNIRSRMGYLVTT